MVKNYHLNLSTKLHKIISIIINNYINDIRIKNTNISKIIISKNIINAKIYVTFLNIKNINIDNQLNILNNSRNFIKKIIFKKKYLFKIPHLLFLYDKLLINHYHLIQLINNLKTY